MDLNAYPQPEDDEYAFDPHFEEDNAPSHVDHAERLESAVEIARREREERRERLRIDRPIRRSQPPVHDHTTYPKSNKSYDRSKLPPGWLGCPAAGQEIAGMVPSKVPLGEFFNDFIPPGKRYSFKQVMHQQRVLRRKLGLVIDLTNTTRYYSPAEWKKEGIKHVKIQCKGRDSVPENEAVNHFVFEVLQFHAHQKEPKKFIFVHCTHGHNRTGYMIVHYLMRTQPISVTQAIKSFAEARPPGIYKPDYIEALYNFYHDKRPDMVECPPTPEWKRSSDLDLNGDVVPDEDDDGNLAASVQENVEAAPVMTLDDVLGDSIPFEQQESFRQFCYHALKLGVGARGHAQFPGSHPVSLNRDNLQLLRQRYYYATWKADGTRYMMLITMDGCYLIDRHFNFRRVQMRFPCQGTNETHHYTLLDGEMVIDSLPDSKHERRYLIYDMIAVNHVSIVERPFYERWKMIESEVIKPRKHVNKSYRYDLEPFRVRRKGFWLLSTVDKLLNEFIPNLSHESDGLIFQGWDDPYVPRTHEGLLKWKYAEMNSVDFLFEVIDGREFLYLHERGKKKLMEGNRVVFSEDADPASYSGKIIECSWHKDEDVWVCMRIRPDKGTPNDFNTYRKVLRSIKDNITEDILLEEITEIIRLPMYADRIRNDSKAAHAQQKLKQAAHPQQKRKREQKDADPTSYSGKIIECSWRKDEDVWVCMRIRLDKGTPNDFNTYRKVLRSIKDNITQDILLKEIAEIIRLPMYADRIHNDSKAAHPQQKRKQAAHPQQKRKREQS